MVETNATLDLEQELSEIPSEYQDTFRQAIEREMEESEQDQTDHELLDYLRQRRDDFRRGGFIRPDGHSGMLALSPEAIYEQALPELVQSNLGETGHTAERRLAFVKVGVFAGVALLFLLFAFRGRAWREAFQEDEKSGTPVVEAALDRALTPLPTLPAITGVGDSLQTIGGLGGALTIGRPSAIELRYSRTEETIALAIDPSRPTTRGELRYSEAVMRSDNPVAVWLFGTVLNYAIGVPDSMVRNLTPGDRISLNTDTGASLRFVVAKTWTGANHEAGRLLSQNRIGLTLFSLPALTADDVSYAFANYDISGEGELVQAVHEVGESFSLGSVEALRITRVQVEQASAEELRIAVNGKQNGTDDDQVIMLSLVAGREQTMAIELTADETGKWESLFALPAGVAGLPLLAEIRALPDGELALVDLGKVPRLIEQLQISLPEATWDGASAKAVFTVSVHNPSEGSVYLGPQFIRFLSEGGDAYESTGQVVPRLPTFVNPGETLGLTVTFLPISASVQVQIGADLWEVTGFPPRDRSNPEG